MSWKNEYQKAQRRKPVEVNQQICVDEDAAEAMIAAEEEHNVRRAHALQRIARSSHDVEMTPEGVEDLVSREKDVQEAQAKFEAAKARYRAATIDFTFRAMGRSEFDALVAEHPPRDADEPLEYNPATFKPALVAACHVYYEKDDEGNLLRDDAGNLIEGAGMTEGEAEEIFATWSKADAESLFNAALAVNVTTRVNFVALGKG